MSGEGFGGALQAVHGGLERLAAPVAFPLRRLALSVVLAPLTWPLTAARMRSHAGAAGPAGSVPWRGVALFLASETGRALLDYALQRAVQSVVAEVQAVAAGAKEEEEAVAAVGGAAGKSIARGAAAVAALAAVSWTARLWLRVQLRRAVLGEAASPRLVAWPSVWSVVLGAFVSVFPFGRLAVLRGPAGLFVRNLLAQAEVRMALDEEHGVLSSLEPAIDTDPRGWGVLVAGLPHGETRLLFLCVRLFA